jgi:hypothetical protein
MMIKFHFCSCSIIHSDSYQFVMKSGRSNALKQDSSGLAPFAHCVGTGAALGAAVLTAMVVLFPTSHVYVILLSLPTVVPTPAIQSSLQLPRYN